MCIAWPPYEKMEALCKSPKVAFLNAAAKGAIDMALNLNEDEQRLVGYMCVDTPNRPSEGERERILATNTEATSSIQMGRDQGQKLSINTQHRVFQREREESKHVAN